MREPIFILALTIAATTILLIVRTIAGAFNKSGASGADLSQIKRQLEQHTGELEDVQAALTNQSTQVAELQERLDFAERLLAQARDRAALGAGEKRT